MLNRRIARAIRCLFSFSFNTARLLFLDSVRAEITKGIEARKKRSLIKKIRAMYDGPGQERFEDALENAIREQRSIV